MNTTTVTHRTGLAVRGRTPNGAAPVIRQKAPEPSSRIVLGFKVERGIPLPERIRNPKGREAKYPYAALEVGESMFIPGMKNPGSSLVKLKKADRKFATRIRTEDDVRGLRVWRTA